MFNEPTSKPSLPARPSLSETLKPLVLTKIYSISRKNFSRKISFGLFNKQRLPIGNNWIFSEISKLFEFLPTNWLKEWLTLENKLLSKRIPESSSKRRLYHWAGLKPVRKWANECTIIIFVFSQTFRSNLVGTRPMIQLLKSPMRQTFEHISEIFETFSHYLKSLVGSKTLYLMAHIDHFCQCWYLFGDPNFIS